MTITAQRQADARPHVLIAGGGIGGLTAALALLRMGIDVDVYEQAAELREVGAGVQLSANGTRALYALGVGESLKALSCEAMGKEIRLWSTGQTWKLFDLGAASNERYGFPYFTVYRPDLLEVLASAVRREKPDALHLATKCTGFTQADDRVTLHFDRGAATGDALIGADGVHSRIREQLFGADQPEFTGLMAWRGTLPMNRLPAHMARLVGTNWIGPGGHVVHYPLHRGELMNFVGVVERADWRIESWSARGTTAKLTHDYLGWHDDVHAMIRSIPAPFKWALMSRLPLERWTVGCVTLLGDACHPTLPFLAQGAVMAIEDGYVVARALKEYGADVRLALERYESARRDRTARMVRGFADNTQRFHNRRLAEQAEAERYIAQEWAEERVSDRYEWLFRYDVTTVAI